MIRIFVALGLSFGLCTSATGFELKKNLIGRVAVFTNDFLGDGHDRWRSGSYFRSTFSGPVWTGDLPETNPILEFRVRGETISPEDATVAPVAGTRPYVGVVAAGLFGHFRHNGTGYRIGGELVATGPQTGVANFVEYAHDLLGFPAPLATSGQLGDAFYPTINAEAFRLIPRSGRRSFDVRPFVEVQAGVETYVRVGADAIFGNSADGALMTRDPVTGQLVTVTTVRRQHGLMPSIGADVAYVASSAYLPSSSGLEVENVRMRARAGARYRSGGRDLFFGMTWLGPEYKGQKSGQVIGSVSFNYSF